MSYFVKEVDDDGNEVYKEVEGVAPEAVPDELFYQDPRYDKVKQESIKRRLKLADAKKTIAELASEEEENPKEEVKKETPPLTDVEALYAEFEKRLEKKQTAKAQQEKSEAQLIENLLKEHNLRPEAKEILRQASDKAEVAAMLAKFNMTFDDAPTGEATPEDILSKALKGVDSRLGLI